MSTGATLATVMSIIAETLGNRGSIQPDCELVRAGIDSSKIINIVALCEEAFKVEFDADDLVPEKLVSPLAIAELLTAKYGVTGPIAS
ncbi:MAG TPA: acyl carrier protein [Steroidobacteraceae bacterium]